VETGAEAVVGVVVDSVAVRISKSAKDIVTRTQTISAGGVTTMRWYLMTTVDDHLIMVGEEVIVARGVGHGRHPVEIETMAATGGVDRAVGIGIDDRALSSRPLRILSVVP